MSTEQAERRLAAILFSYIVGYTAQWAQSEANRREERQVDLGRHPPFGVVGSDEVTALDLVASS